MQTLHFPIGGGLRTPAALFRPRLGFGNSRSTYAKEIADVGVCYASQRGTFQLSILCIKSEGNRGGRVRRNASMDKTWKEADSLKDLPTSNDNQDEVMALLKSIQTLISKHGPAASRSRNLKSQKKKKTDERIPKFPKQEHVRVPRKDDGAVFSERSELLKGETTNNIVFSDDAKVARPVSKFVKRSPIPPPSLAQENSKDVAEEQLQSVMRDKVAEIQLQPVTTDRVSDLQNLDEMKLSDLKELAKRRGLKGCSRMKKGELLELLKGLLEST